MLDELLGCIETLRKRMTTHATSLQANEWRTRTQLIDPLLCALGWDVSDPVLVTPEYNVGRSRADYALLQPGTIPLAVIEAKALSDTLTDDHRTQMTVYANNLGIKYAGLTNGNHWELYDVFQPVALEKKRILDLSIADEHPHTCALKLLLFWRSNLLTSAPQAANVPLVSITPPNLPPPPSEDWVPLTKYDPPQGTKPPKSIRFWDGKEQTIKYWNELLILTAEKLYVEGTLKTADTPIQLWSGAWHYIHTKPVHADGTEWRKPLKPIGDPPLFVNVNLSGAYLREGTIRLLKKYQLDPAGVCLLPRE